MKFLSCSTYKCLAVASIFSFIKWLKIVIRTFVELIGVGLHAFFCSCLSFFITDISLLSYRSHTIQVIHLNHTMPWLIEYSQICATIYHSQF